jgi:hypothetical protein
MKNAENRTLNCFAASSPIALCHQLRLHHVLQGWAEVLQDDGDINWRF